MTTEELQEKLGDQRWRLNNIYLILDKDGKQVQFKMNAAQESLYDNMHTRNVICKARQEGISTFVDLFILDSCLFNKGVEAVIIADTLPNSEEIFRRKILYPYEHLPDELRNDPRLRPREGTKGSSGQLQLANESVINVAVSARSSTAQIIHSSELAKVAAEHPDKAEEFVSGTLGADSSDNAVIFIESTARGGSGVFWNFCKRAMDAEKEVKAGTRKLHKLDWKWHFFPWQMDKKYSLETDVVIPDRLVTYFEKLKNKHGIELTRQQKNWYAHTESEREDKMRSEYPSYDEEAFEQTILGAYFTRHSSSPACLKCPEIPLNFRLVVSTQVY